MRDALAHSVVDRHERAIRRQGRFDGASEALRACEKGRDQIGGQFGECFVVNARNEEYVAHEERARIEEPEACFVFEDTVRLPFARHDLAEEAGHAPRLALSWSGRAIACRNARRLFCTACAALFKHVASVAVLGSVALASPSGAPDNVQVPKGAAACDTADADYVLAANLQVKGTMMGAGDGVHKVGPGRLVLRWKSRGEQTVVEILSYELRQRFVVTSKTVFGGVTVVSDVVTRAMRGARPIAQGTVQGNSVHWEGPPQGLRSDGSLTCEGTLCGKFGAPPPGSSETHMDLTAARLEPFALSADRKTFTMPYSLMSKSDSPKQSSFVAISGRELGRSCVTGGHT